MARIRKLLDRFEPAMAKAFRVAISEIVSKIVLQDLIAAIELGNEEEAIEALHVEPAAFQKFTNETKQVFDTGGENAVGNMPKDPRGQQLLVRFDGFSQRASDWLRDFSSTKITRITNDQRVAVRAVLQEGVTRGENPRKIALDIAGRIDPITKTRKGGIIGLTSHQEAFVSNASRELTEQPLAFLERKARDKRFDRTIQKAVNDGRALTPEERTNILTRYKDRLLKVRADTIARTETLAALHAGNREGWQQALDAGRVIEREISREWSSAGDSRVRDTHSKMDGQIVGWNERFVSPSGARLRYPGDPLAPPEEIIECRCDEITRVDFISRLR